MLYNLTAKLRNIIEIMHIFPYFLLFSYIFAIFAPFNRIIMSEKFPYGYDVNAYIDKAFERMKKFRIALVMTLASVRKWIPSIP